MFFREVNYFTNHKRSFVVCKISIIFTKTLVFAVQLSRNMPEQITPHIEQFYDDAEIWPIIKGAPYLEQQFNEPDILHNTVVVVLPLVHRQPGYLANQFDLYLFIKHHLVTDLGQLELYRVQDFVRQKVDVAPLMHALQQIAGVDTTQVLESIKRQLKFLQRPENRDLPVAPAQMVNSNG